MLHAKKALLSEDNENDFYPLDIEDIPNTQSNDSELNNCITRDSDCKYKKGS